MRVVAARKRGVAGGTPALPGAQAYPCKPIGERAGARADSSLNVLIAR